jgi:hypothetical protein
MAVELNEGRSYGVNSTIQEHTVVVVLVYSDIEALLGETVSAVKVSTSWYGNINKSKAVVDSADRDASVSMDSDVTADESVLEVILVAGNKNTVLSDSEGSNPSFFDRDSQGDTGIGSRDNTTTRSNWVSAAIWRTYNIFPNRVIVLVDISLTT